MRDSGEAGSTGTTKPEVSPLAWVRLVMLVLGCAFGLFIGVRDLYVALGERTPAHFDIDTFPEHYQGQHWLEIRGRLAVAQRSIRRFRDQLHADAPVRWSVTVPVVSEAWEPTQPVHALADYGPFTDDELRAWLIEAPRIDRIQGQVLRGPAIRILPNQGQTLVTIDVGNQPSVITAVAFSSLMLVFGFIGGWVLINEIGDRMRARKSRPPL